MGHILDINLPERNPGGAPGGDYERIESSPVDFGGSVGQAEEKLGGAIGQAGETGMNALIARQQLTNEVHSSEVNTWLADKITDRYSEFAKLEGRAALDGLPTFKKDIGNLYQQSYSQAGSPSEQAMIAKSGRVLTDSYYRYGTTHADTQFRTWQDKTSENRATTFGNMAVLAVNHPDDMKRYLDTSDGEVSKLYEGRGWDRDAIDNKISENRGYNVRKLVDQQMAIGDPNQAAEIFAANRQRMDAASIVQVEKALKPKLQAQAFEVGGAVALGREPAQDAFQFHERSSGLPSGYTARVINLESGGDPNAVSGSYKGLAQFSAPLMKKYGVSDPGDVAQNAGALMQEAAENRPALARVLGRDPTAAELYLAHQQGVGGAAAQLANPDRPAWQNMASTAEGRTKGPDWARQAIWGNMTPQMKEQFPGGVDTVTGGDFTKLWGQRYNRGGDQVPIIDKAEAYKRADSMFGNDPVMWRGVRSVIDREVNYQNTVFAGRRTELNKQVPDILAAAADGNTTLSLPPDLQLLGAEKAKQIEDQFAVANAIGTYRQRLKWASPGEVGEIQRDLEGGTGPVSQTIRSHADRGSTGPGTAGVEASGESAEFYRQRKAGATAFNAASEARDKLLVGPSADPAAYVADHPEVMKAARALDFSKPETVDKYVSTVLGLQEYLGVPPSQRKLLPTGAVEQVNEIINGAASSDDPKARVGVIATVNQLAKQWGSHWPDVVAQLAPESQPLVRAIAAGADQTAMTRLLNLDPKDNPAKVLKEQNDVKARDVGNALNTEMAPFLSSMVGRQRDRDYSSYYHLAEKLASLYVRDGKDASTAAHDAFNALVGNRYDFRDTYRIPKDPNLSPDDVQRGAQSVRGDLEKLGAQPAVDDIGGMSDARGDSFKKFGRDGVWVTSPRNDGLNLAYGDKWVRGADGQPLFIPWAKLAAAGKAAGADTSAPFQGAQP